MTVFRIATLSMLLLGLCSIPTLAENTDAKNVSIPELPEEVAADETAQAENEPQVITYDDSAINLGFFSNTSANQGFARFLNAFQISGYLRTRFNYFRDGHLRTYIPAIGRGTSNFLPNLTAYSNPDVNEVNPAQNNFSGNMRLRLDPTINISETMRVRATVDLFDNMVLGSTPSYMAGGSINPSVPVSMMSMSQHSPTVGINSLDGAISLKRAWGEASFPIGELRFGRMPFHWGLGLLYHSGDTLDSDYGDQVDGVAFSTRVFEHYLTPGYFIAYSGPNARGGGLSRSAANFPNYLVHSELGQRYPLEAKDLTHVFTLSLLKRSSDFLTHQRREEGKAIFSYGLFTSFRMQSLDSQNDSPTLKPNMEAKVVKREGKVGLLSFWSAFSWGTFHTEMEFAGIWGKYQIGEKAADLLARNDGSGVTKQDVWLLGGGFALESKYGFLSDRLQLGLDGGWASSHSGPGFGLREGSAEGQKSLDNGFKTNFKFNPGYTVDLLLYREILGGISGTYYFKPHLAYFFNRNFGLRSDVIASFAQNKSNTSGNSNFLGVEVDGTAFLRTDSGFYLSLAYGILFPLKGLNHQSSNDITPQDLTTYGNAKIAQTIQTYLGLSF